MVLKHCIEKAGGNTVVRLPTREDGYGIKPQHVEEFKKMGINTIITVDNGVTAFEAVEAAKQHGMNILITDHHEPRNILPDCIVVNPKYEGMALGIILEQVWLIFWAMPY